MCEFGGDLAPTVECTELFIISAYGMGLYPDTWRLLSNQNFNGPYMYLEAEVVEEVMGK